jgi:hypothetical protein
MRFQIDFHSSVGQLNKGRSKIPYARLTQEERNLLWAQIKRDSEEIQILFPNYNIGIPKSFCHKDR